MHSDKWEILRDVAFEKFAFRMEISITKFEIHANCQLSGLVIDFLGYFYHQNIILAPLRGYRPKNFIEKVLKISKL